MIACHVVRIVSVVVVVAVGSGGAVLEASAGAAAPAAEQLAGQILETSGVRGGLVVHLGCGSGKLTAALRAGDAYLVHGLDSDADNIQRARAHIRARGLCGGVSVERLTTGRLPYVDGQLAEPTEPHIFAPAGFLDGQWWHRMYWLVGTQMSTNYGGWPRVGSRVPAGRLLVTDGDDVYGFGRNRYVHHGAHIGIDGAMVFHVRPDRDENQRWTRTLPLLARAMVRAGDTLYLAGPPEPLESDDPHAALAGKKGGYLIALTVDDGTPQFEVSLDSSPVFDGMAVAAGRLYLATMDGQVICLGGAAE